MNILIIDDHQLFIDGLGYVLKALADEVVITETNRVDEAIEKLEKDHDYDLILLDINMPSLDGLSLLHRFTAEELCIPVVIISAEHKAGLIRQALDWGVMGFIPKSHNASQMIDGLNAILEGTMYLPEEVQKRLDRLPLAGQKPNTASTLKKIGISQKQLQTLELMAKGLSNQQIAVTLGRSEHTIKSHISVLFRALGASNRTECVKLGIRQLLIEDDAYH